MIRDLGAITFFVLAASACSGASATYYPTVVSDHNLGASSEVSPSLPEVDIPRRATQSDGELDRQTVYVPDDVSQTHGGVTVRISRVVYSSAETIIELTVLASPEYGFIWDELLLPQYAYLLNDFELTDDQGRVVRGTSGEYGFARSDPSRQVAFDHRYSFEAPSAGAKVLSLEMSSVILGNLYASQVMGFSLEDVTLGHEWELNQTIEFGPISVVFERARLVEATGQLHSFRLEADYSHVASEFQGTLIHVTCLRMYPVLNSSFSNPQDSNCEEAASISYIEFGSAKILNPALPSRPLQLRAVTDIIVEGPWTLSWLIEP